MMSLRMNLWDEIFFLVYHLRISIYEAINLSVYHRKWFIEKFIDQKEKEHKAMERERRKNK